MCGRRADPPHNTQSELLEAAFCRFTSVAHGTIYVFSPSKNRNSDRQEIVLPDGKESSIKGKGKEKGQISAIGTIYTRASV
jgi:hypothetical protein